MMMPPASPFMAGHYMQPVPYPPHMPPNCEIYLFPSYYHSLSSPSGSDVWTSTTTRNAWSSSYVMQETPIAIFLTHFQRHRTTCLTRHMDKPLHNLRGHREGLGQCHRSQCLPTHTTIPARKVNHTSGCLVLQLMFPTSDSRYALPYDDATTATRRTLRTRCSRPSTSGSSASSYGSLRVAGVRVFFISFECCLPGMEIGDWHKSPFM